MNISLSKKLLSLILLLGLIVLSCDKEDEPDPDPISVSFTNSSGVIAENSTTPFSVTITSSVAAPGAGSVDVGITGATYGTDYTTSEGSANFTASFVQGATFATFSLQPVDNSEEDGNKTLTITLSGATGLVQLGSNTTFTLTIQDDDMRDPSATLASIRGMYSGTDVNITEETIISGVVISTNDATNDQNIIIQNGTDGLLVRFTEAHTIPRGQNVEIDINGGTIGDFNDLVQVTNVPTSAITDLGAGTIPDPQVITIAELNTGNYESELVSIEGGTFAAANGSTTIQGNNDFTVGTETTVVRVSGPDWETNILPRGMGTVTGIAGIFQGTHQVLPQIPEDFFEDMAGMGGDTTAASIADIRAMYSGSDLAINTNTTITGVVISSIDATNNQNIVLQNGTDGIIVRLDAPHSFARGNELTVNLNGGTLSDFNDLVQVQGLTSAAVEDNGASTLPTPQIVTITEFKTGNYESELVTIQNAQFPDADGAKTVNGNNDLVVGTDMTIMRVSGPSWSSNLLPFGMGDITGIGGIFQGTVQILPQIESEIFASMAQGSMTITQSLQDFGSAMTNMPTASQSYTVETSMATSNIIITATGGFELSTDDMSFSSSVELDFNATNAGPVTVYVRFNAISGVAGLINGTITHTSTGIATQSFSVSGTEDANLMTLASTSFEEGNTGTRYFDTGDASVAHDLVNNAGQSDVDFTASATEMGYDASFVPTRNGGVGLTDGDDVGVVSDVSVVGSYTDGSQGYSMSDCDGRMVLTFDAVDVSGVTTKAVSLDLFIQSTGWESDDNIRIYVIADGTTEEDIFNTTGMDIDDNFGSMEGMWNSISQTVTATSTVTLVIELDSNSGSENIFFDNVMIVGSN